MDTAIGIMFDHAGPIGLALTILAIYWLQALGVLVVPTWRARVEWVDTPESVTEQAQQLVQVASLVYLAVAVVVVVVVTLLTFARRQSDHWDI